MVNIQNSKGNCKEFEAKFARGEYITPAQLEDILMREEKLDEYFPNRCVHAPWRGSILSQEEFTWLKENHPEYTAAYEKELSPQEREISLGPVEGIAVIAFYGGIGYGIYKLFFD